MLTQQHFYLELQLLFLKTSATFACFKVHGNFQQLDIF